MRDYSRMTSWTHVDFLLSFASPKPSIRKCTLEFNLMNYPAAPNSFPVLQARLHLSILWTAAAPPLSTVQQSDFRFLPLSGPFPMGEQCLPLFMALRDLLLVSRTSSALQGHSQCTTLYHHLCICTYCVLFFEDHFFSSVREILLILCILWKNSSKWCIFWKS